MFSKIIGIILICFGIYLLSIISWQIFVRLFKMFDDYMMDRHFKKMGYEKLKCQEDKTWYVG